MRPSARPFTFGWVRPSVRPPSVCSSARAFILAGLGRLSVRPTARRSSVRPSVVAFTLSGESKAKAKAMWEKRVRKGQCFKDKEDNQVKVYQDDITKAHQDDVERNIQRFSALAVALITRSPVHGSAWLACGR